MWHDSREHFKGVNPVEKLHENGGGIDKENVALTDFLDRDGFPVTKVMHPPGKGEGINHSGIQETEFIPPRQDGYLRNYNSNVLENIFSEDYTASGNCFFPPVSYIYEDISDTQK